MVTALHWDIREYIADFRDNPEQLKGSEARFPILVYLTLRANARNRTHVSTKRIMQDTGFGKEAVAAALAWLFEYCATKRQTGQHRTSRTPRRHTR